MAVVGICTVLTLALPSREAFKLGTGETAAKASGQPVFALSPGRSLTQGSPENYWVKEMRRRWKLELLRRHNREHTIDRLRTLNRSLMVAVRNVRADRWLWDAFMCIHRYEGAWNANTGNGYHGGLQMDWSFMRAYGPELLRAKGTADRWTPAEQIRVAIKAYESGRGFHPWPNTARMCGLL